MTSLIIGFGEVGKGLLMNLRGEYKPDVYDSAIHGEHPENWAPHYDIIHICIPCLDQASFIEIVKAYQIRFTPTYTVIHSTVPVGTSTQLGAVHSPIRGLHPNLDQGIKTFVKFLGGPQAGELADYFRRAGMKVCVVDKAETTELGKLLDTEYYRACIEFAHKAKELCDAYALPYHEVYTLFNTTYNEGYTQLGYPEYVRPVLQPIPGPIGGHCVLPNKALLAAHSPLNEDGSLSAQKPSGGVVDAKT